MNLFNDLRKDLFAYKVVSILACIAILQRKVLLSNNVQYDTTTTTAKQQQVNGYV